MTFALLDEQRQEHPQPVQHAPQVDVDHSLPLIDIESRHPAAATDTGVVAHQVNGAK